MSDVSGNGSISLPIGRPIVPRGRRQSGFSLLEVVVAFAILALTLGVLMQIFSRALGTTALSGEYSRAASLAESRLNAVGSEIPLEVGSYTGEPEDGFSWEVVIDPFQPQEVAWEPAFDAFFITSTASWGEGDDRRREISLTSLRLAQNAEIAASGAEEDAPTGREPR